MRIVYTEQHLRHAPEHELTRRGLIPYTESPDRVSAILQALGERGFTDVIPPREYPPEILLDIHDAAYLHYLEKVYAEWVASGQPDGGAASVTFALRGRARRPESLADQVGYYCFDTTPVVAHTYTAARFSAHCAVTGADLLLAGEGAAYALCRPPGHHAGRDLYGGYCYLNNAALAAAYLNRHGRVALLDIDYHHGNGTQDIFYDSDQVLFVSIHADPARQYPFFWGRADEEGTGAGLGYNHNLPLPAGVDDEGYLQVLDEALVAIREFAPAHLVVSLGVDTLGGDYWGDFELSPEGFGGIGQRLAAEQIPTLLVQEGGYHPNHMGAAVANVLQEFCC